MTYLIDAWLERAHPCLRILHRETGEVCVLLEEEALDELRDQGDLELAELNSCEPVVVKELVRNLFLFCYARALRPNGEPRHPGCGKRLCEESEASPLGRFPA
jgi:hypothetical protein